MYECYFSNSIYLKYHAEEARHSEVKYNIYYVVQHQRLLYDINFKLNIEWH